MVIGEVQSEEKNYVICLHALIAAHVRSRRFFQMYSAALDHLQWCLNLPPTGCAGVSISLVEFCREQSEISKIDQWYKLGHINSYPKMLARAKSIFYSRRLSFLGRLAFYLRWSSYDIRPWTRENRYEIIEKTRKKATHVAEIWRKENLSSPPQPSPFRYYRCFRWQCIRGVSWSWIQS